MKKRTWINEQGERVNYLAWAVEAPKAAVVIAHGMTEHPGRYKPLATFLNRHGIAAYGVYHIGHGQYAQTLHHMDKGDFDRCIANVHELVGLVRQELQVPVILLGHSMGSFMSQLYVTRYNDLDGLILSGSTTANLVTKAGAALASVLCALSRDRAKPSQFVYGLAFGSYNKPFPNPRTDYDWLSRDELQVDRYVQDPYCGGVCSIGFFQNLTGGMAKMGKSKYIRNVPKDLPIYIQGGSMDPVSNLGKGLYALKKQYERLGVRLVRLDVYEGARHEIFNELNKEEVFQNTLEFILSVLP